MKMRTKKQTWIKESNDCYTEGNYYKLNLSAFVRYWDFDKYPFYEIIIRNTWTQDEKILSRYETKTEAIKNLRKFTLDNPSYQENTFDKVKGLDKNE
jgi:hypothetical protein